jgi:hypothetical protein
MTGFTETERLLYNFARCQRKRRYPTRAKARKALKRWHKRGAFDIYHCRMCDGFHLGSRRKVEFGACVPWPGQDGQTLHPAAGM